jgi:hypothetical protein
MTTTAAGATSTHSRRNAADQATTRNPADVRGILTKLAPLFAAAALAAASAPAAEAAVPKGGVWRGELTHLLASGVEYEPTMVMTAYRGRIQSVVATVRMECGTIDAPETYGVRDARVVHSWRTGRGPRISSRGTYAFRADGAYFHGRLSKSSAVGGASARYGDDCHGTGRHNLQRR